MKKALWASLLMGTMILGACGSTEDAKKTETTDKAATEETAKETTKDTKQTATADSRLKEVPEDANCEMCNMHVYTKEEDMGMFSAQAIKADGSIAYYDDIGCLLNAEVANNEKNEKFVRDFNTLEWVKVEDATIVKTNLKSPMNWGYVYFAKKEDADKYIAENKDAKVEELQTIKDAALERRKQKMKKMQEQGQGMNGNMNGNMNGQQNGQGQQNGMDNMNHEGHNHQ